MSRKTGIPTRKLMLNTMAQTSYDEHLPIRVTRCVVHLDGEPLHQVCDILHLDRQRCDFALHGTEQTGLTLSFPYYG